MLRIFLAFWLAVTPALADGVAAPIAVAPIGGNNTAVSFPPISGSSPLSFNHIDSVFTEANNDTLTDSVSFPSSGPCLTVVATGFGNGTNAGISQNVTVGVTTLNQDIIQIPGLIGIGQVGVYSAYFSTCPGTQTVTYTVASGGPFVERTMTIWVVQNMVSHSVVQTAGYNTGTSASLSVTTGDLMFGAARNLTTTPSCSSSTQAPSDTYGYSGDSGTTAQFDWTIAVTNASFSFNCGTSSSNVAATATYH